ncbi:MAG: flippase-like domain-containing protein [bacterium]|nr:flippase-like domain-containing protein [bacterium]
MKRALKLRWLKIFLPIIGLVILAGVVHRIGFHSLAGQLSHLGWNFFPILGLSVVNYFLFTVAWWLCLDRDEKTFSFWKLFKVKTIGEAVNAVTPLNWAAGDPVRIYLMRDELHWQGGTRSVVVDRTLYIFSVLVFIGIGTTLFLSYHVLPTDIFKQLMIGLGCLSVGFSFFFLIQRRGFFASLLKVARLLRLEKKIPEKRRTQLREIDLSIRQAYRRGGWKVIAALLLQFTTRCVMVLETTMILYSFGTFPRFGLLWGLTAIVPLVNLLFSFIPGSLGILEGMNGILFHFLNLNPATGVSLQLVRRMRAACWGIVGWAFLYFHRSNKAIQKVIEEAEEEFV